MKENSFCDDFQELLDRFAAKSLPPDEIDLLHSHAKECEACAMLLRVHENLAQPSIDELTEQIPETMPAQIWDRVAESLPREHRSRERHSFGWLRSARLVPALALTTVIFLLMNIFLFTELRQLRSKEHQLTDLLTQQTQVLEEIRDQRMHAPIVRNAEDTFNKNRLRMISGQQTMSVTELRSFLEQVPPDIQILTGSYIENLLSQLPSWEKAKFEHALKTIEASDGIQSREALILLDALDLDPDDTITPARLAALTQL